MKIFGIQGFYRLPDDFEGGVSEALRALADWLDSPKPTNDHVEPWPPKATEAWKEIYHRFVAAEKMGYRFSGCVGIDFGEPGKWHRQPHQVK